MDEGTKKARLQRYLLLVVTAVAAIADFLFARFLRDPWAGVAVALATSVLASALFYVMYSWIAEAAAMEDVAARVARSIGEKITKDRMYQPTRVFPESNDGLPEYNTCFLEALEGSHKYYFRGDSGNYASCRLADLAAKGLPDVNDIMFILADPREEQVLRCRATLALKDTVHTLKDAIEIQNACVQTEDDGHQRSTYEAKHAAEVEKIRREIFRTYVALFDMRGHGRVGLAFHSEVPLFRSEILDSGVFISYYSSKKYPVSFFYGSDTHLFECLVSNFCLNLTDPRQQPIYFDNQSENDLQDKLHELGCQAPISELRASFNGALEQFQASRSR